jgi:hypothetical protein
MDLFQSPNQVLGTLNSHTTSSIKCIIVISTLSSTAKSTRIGTKKFAVLPGLAAPSSEWRAWKDACCCFKKRNMLLLMACPAKLPLPPSTQFLMSRHGSSYLFCSSLFNRHRLARDARELKRR